MRSARVRNVRFIDLTGDVEARIPKGCRHQTNERGVIAAFRFFAIVLSFSLFSRSLVYAASDYVFTKSGSGEGASLAFGSISDKPALVYLSNVLPDERSNANIAPELIDYFSSDSDITIRIDNVSVTNRSTSGCSWNFSQPLTGYVRTTVSGKEVDFNFNVGEDFTFPFEGGDTFVFFNAGTTRPAAVSVTGKYTYKLSFDVICPSRPLSDNEALNEINDKMQQQIDQDKQFHDEDIQKGEQSGSDASKMVDDLTDQVKTKWEILFYPIEFTKKFLALFTGSSGGSTSITFPAFSLTVDGGTYQVWEEYTYDLSTLKSQFSVLFTGLHMIVGVLEVGWFIKYLYSKYDEVFGGDSE